MKQQLAALKGSKSRVGITIIEVMISLAIIGIVGASSLWAFTCVNRYALITRLYSAAQGVARGQIELIQIDTPFNPQFNQIPPDLVVGTRTETDVSIYADPQDPTLEVTGTMTTTISDPGWAISGVALNARQARVTVTYVYRGKTYNVTMNTIRVSDI